MPSYNLPIYSTNKETYFILIKINRDKQGGLKHQAIYISILAARSIFKSSFPDPYENLYSSF